MAGLRFRQKDVYIPLPLWEEIDKLQAKEINTNGWLVLLLATGLDVWKKRAQEHSRETRLVWTPEEFAEIQQRLEAAKSPMAAPQALRDS